MLVWTLKFQPYMMGETNSKFVGVEVDPGPELDFGREFRGYVITSPVTGDTHVVEKESGALVGNSLKDTRYNIATDPFPEQMRQRISDAVEIRNSGKIDVLPADKFWSLFRQNSE